MTPEAYRSALGEAWFRYSDAQFDPPHSEPRDHLWASSIRTCTRRMALDLKHPEVGRDFDPAAKEKMLRGRERESAIVARLMQIGPRCSPPFTVIESQTRFRVTDRDGTLLCTGKVDGRLDFGGGVRPIYEVKSGRGVAGVKVLEDLYRSEWTRHYPDQLLLYLYGASEPFGFLICETDSGPVFLLVVLEENLWRVEELLIRMRAAVDARHGRASLPDFHDDPSVCRRCPHLGINCAPSIGYSGVQVVDDPELEELLAEREALADSAKRFEKVHKEVGLRLGRDYEQLLVGNFLVTAKRGRKTTTDIPWGAIECAARHMADFEPAAGAELLAGVANRFKVTEEGGTFSHVIERIAE